MQRFALYLPFSTTGLVNISDLFDTYYWPLRRYRIPRAVVDSGPRIASFHRFPRLNMIESETVIMRDYPLRHLFGISGGPPSLNNRMRLRISSAPGKSLERFQILEEIILGKSASDAVPERVIGRMGFAQADVFSRFARSMMNSLYARFYSPPFSPLISKLLFLQIYGVFVFDRARYRNT